ncbi:MAG: AAA family ATPase, partial [Chitinophagales bacterium]|nr:AAA family ATPase [Chitinophagales bacterium]
MSKQKSLFVCQSCGTNSPKWMGKCNTCGEWNSFVEEIITKEPSNSITHIISIDKAKPILLEDVENIHLKRIETNDSEFNRVLGGGIVPGSMVLIGGDPGIGKSTLLIQIAMQTLGKKILYISGEESEQQIKMRAQRIGGENNLVYVFTETNVETILQQADQIKPDILIIDSIQTVQTARAESVMGSVSQIRETANILQQYAKKKNVPTFLIGHITKEGYIAGPK